MNCLTISDLYSNGCMYSLLAFLVSISSVVTPMINAPPLASRLAAPLNIILCPLCRLSKVPPITTLSNCLYSLSPSLSTLSLSSH